MKSAVALIGLLTLGLVNVALAAGAPLSSRDVAVQAMTDIFGYRDPTAVERYFAAPYKQHNLGIADGLDALKTLVSRVPNIPGLNITIHRTLVDGDLVLLHSVYDGFTFSDGKPLVAFDLFRVKDGRLVEHWDALMPLGPPNASGRSLIDGPGAVTDLYRTEANRALVQSFVDTVFVKRQLDRAGEFIAEDYRQHNPRVGDGLAAFQTALQGLASSGTLMTYKPHRVLAEGNFVFVQAEGGPGAMLIYDLFRLQDGKIVEHWDVMAPILPRDQWKNDNGPF